MPSIVEFWVRFLKTAAYLYPIDIYQLNREWKFTKESQLCTVQVGNLPQLTFNHT